VRHEQPARQALLDGISAAARGAGHRPFRSPDRNPSPSCAGLRRKPARSLRSGCFSRRSRPACRPCLRCPRCRPPPSRRCGR
jgi:hypothetical protein